MSSSNSRMNEHKDTEIQTQNSDLANSQNAETSTTPASSKGNDDLSYFLDQESMELYSRARAQQDEIMFLREQIALASIKESQLLNEKYALEKKFSELRMVLDEKQNEAITSASNELAHRKVSLEENIKLIYELKVAEDERYIFMSSVLGLLGEYGIWPRLTNASQLTRSVKDLHDQFQLKIQNSYASVEGINSMIGYYASRRPVEKQSPTSSGMNSQQARSSMGIHGFSSNEDGLNLDAAVQDNHAQTGSLMLNHEVSHSVNNDNLLRPSSETDRHVAGPIGHNLFDGSGVYMKSEDLTNHQFYYSPAGDGGFRFVHSEEEGPGIDGFQIIGDAYPGCRLLGCGYPVSGTSLCIFQWFRHYPDGTREDIEGATNPEYIVTVDDVDKVIAVECIPIDDQGRQGELVRCYANDSNKITCNPDMQLEIDSYASKGHATFNLLMLMDSSENWEPATLILRESRFQVKLYKTQEIMLEEKFSKDLNVRITSGLSPQFVLTFSDGSSHPFSTNNDIRTRDVLVLTMRIFQRKALDEKRKGKS